MTFKHHDFNNRHLTESQLYSLLDFMDKTIPIGINISPHLVNFIINYCVDNEFLYSEHRLGILLNDIKNLNQKNYILQDRLKKSNIEKLEEQINSLKEQYEFLKSDYDDLIEELNNHKY